MYGMFVTRVVRERERVESCPFFNFCAIPCRTTLHVFTKIGFFLVPDFHLFLYSYTPPYTCNIIFHIIVVYENCNCSSVNLFGHFSSIYFDYCLTYFIGIHPSRYYLHTSVPNSGHEN